MLTFWHSILPCHFQQTMDGILQDIPHVICYLDDILLTESEHLQNSEEVFRRLQKHGIKVKSEKCVLLQDSIPWSLY